MLPAHLTSFIAAPLEKLVTQLQRTGITFTHLTMLSLVTALAMIALIALGHHLLALIPFLLNRLCTFLDTPLAQLQAEAGEPPSGFSAIIDTLCDVFLYAGAVLGVVIGLQQFSEFAVFLLFAWLLSACTSLLFQAEAASRGVDENLITRPALVWFDGIASKTEMTIVLLLICAMPGYFPAIAMLHGFLCLFTTGARAMMAYRYLR